MKITVRIADDLMPWLKQRAHAEGVSLNKLINRLLRQAVHATEAGSETRPPFREKAFHMGQPKANLDKALALAASLEDEEVRAKRDARMTAQ